jgi:hypothetical protein
LASEARCFDASISVRAATDGSNTGAYTERAVSSSASRRRAAAGSSSRSARSSRPEATRAIEVTCSSPSSGARARTSSRTARSESRRNGTAWQRERIVSGSGPTSSATSTITA